MTKEAFEKLKNEIEDLEYNTLPTILKEVSTARGNGDLSENAEYHAAKDKQRSVMRRLGYLKDFKVNAQVIDCSELTNDTIKFGCYVEIFDIELEKTKTIRLVGDYEADITKNLISIEAPLGKAIMGKKNGDIVEFETNDNIFSYEIKKIYYK